MTRIGALVLPGVLVLAWLLLSAPGGFNTFDVLGGFAAACAGVLAGALWPRLHRGAGRAIVMADDILGDGVNGSTGPAGEEESEGDALAVDEGAAPAARTTLLIGLKEFLGATRVVLWGEAADGGRLSRRTGRDRCRGPCRPQAAHCDGHSRNGAPSASILSPAGLAGRSWRCPSTTRAS